MGRDSIGSIDEDDNICVCQPTCPLDCKGECGCECRAADRAAHSFRALAACCVAPEEVDALWAGVRRRVAR
jgi:hypothetical protein